MKISKAALVGASVLLAVATFATVVGCISKWSWYADQFTHYRPHCLVATVIVGVILAFRRHWRLVAVTLAVIAINLWVLVPHQMPFHRVSDSPTPVLRVLTLNLLQGNRRPEEVLNFLSDSGADVIVLQEVTNDWKSRLGTLEIEYPFSHWHPRKDQFGLAILSARRLDEVEFRQLGDSPANVAVLAKFQHSGRSVRIAGIHPDKLTRRWKTLARSEYFDGIVKWMKEFSNEPVIVAGDFNATPWSVSFGKFKGESGLRDTSAGHVFDGTWNRSRPDRLLIDHVLVSRDFALVDRNVGRDVGSDHRPLVVDLQLD